MRKTVIKPMKVFIATIKTGRAMYILIGGGFIPILLQWGAAVA